MLLSAWASEGRLEAVPLALFAAVAAAALVLGLRMYRAIGPEPAGAKEGG
jgi:hypothetical protein